MQIIAENNVMKANNGLYKRVDWPGLTSHTQAHRDEYS
jgi:hypothetical protein